MNETNKQTNSKTKAKNTCCKGNTKNLPTYTH